jgi:hypothetical protein
MTARTGLPGQIARTRLPEDNLHGTIMTRKDNQAINLFFFLIRAITVPRAEK